MADAITEGTLHALLRFPFQKSRWQRDFFIGSALTFFGFWIPIVPWVFVAGYAAGVMRQAIAGGEPTLPEWEDWRRLGRDGVRLIGATLVYLLPGTFVLVSSLGLYLWASIVLPLALSNVGNNGPVAVTLVTLGLTGITALFLMSWGVGSALILAGALPLPLIAARIVDTESFRATFHIAQWAKSIRRNTLGYLIAWIIAAGLLAFGYVGLTLAVYSVALCAAIPFLAAPVAFYTLIVSAALFGRIYRESQE